MPNLSEKHIAWITWILLFILPMQGMTIDLIAPSLPAIAHALDISSGAAKNIISFYLLGYALGNFSGGILTDSFGRRKLLLGSLACFVVASLIPIFYPDITVLYMARILQGITLGAVSVVNRAIFADLYPAEKLTKLGVLFGTMFGIGPIIGPFIGGYLQYYFGWQSCFVFFAVVMMIELILIFLVVPETHHKRQPFCAVSIKRNIQTILKHKEFMTLIMMMGLVYSLIISFNILAPFLVETRFHYSAIFFGHLALFMGLSFLLATFVCRYSLSKYPVRQLLSTFVKFLFVFSVFALAGSYIFPESIVFLSIISGIMFFTSGFIFPMSLGYGLSFFRHIAGTATATMYLVNISIASLVGFLVSLLKIETIIPMMWVYFVIIALIFFICSRLINASKNN